MEEIPAYIVEHKVYCLGCFVNRKPPTEDSIDPILPQHQWAFYPVCCCCGKEIKVVLVHAPPGVIQEGAHIVTNRLNQATVVCWAMRTSTTREYDWYLVQPIRCEYVELWARADMILRNEQS